MKEKISDLIISGLLKKGICYEARCIDTEIDIPIIVGNYEKKVTVKIKCENMKIHFDENE